MEGRERGRGLVLLPVLLTVFTWLVFVTNRAPGTPAALDGFPLDDAWIHGVYARSLVDEGGLNYNSGVPETGMTSPLWVVALAGVHAIVPDRPHASAPPGASASSPRNPARHVVLATKIVGLTCGIAGVVGLFELALALGQGPWVALAAASLAAINPSLGFARASGMEVPLFVALALFALVAAVRARPRTAGLLAGLSVTARPEGILLLPVVAFLIAVSQSDRAPRAGRLLAALGFALLPALAYSGFCLWATGVPLPNTFYAKFASRPMLSPETLSALALGWNDYVRANLPYFTFEAGTVLALAGLAGLALERRRAALVALAAGPILFAAALATRSFAPGHSFYWERWVSPAFPFLLLAIAIGGRIAVAAVDRLAGSLRAADGVRWLARGLVVTTLAAAVLLPWRRALYERADLFAWNCQNIEEMNVALGRWIDTRLPRGAVVAVNDAGALRYFGNRATVNLVGLNDHRVLRRDRSRGVATLAERGVDYFVVFPSWFRDLGSAARLEPLGGARAKRYTICDCDQDLMMVYAWQPEDRAAHLGVREP